MILKRKDRDLVWFGLISMTLVVLVIQLVSRDWKVTLAFVFGCAFALGAFHE